MIKQYRNTSHFQFKNVAYHYWQVRMVADKFTGAPRGFCFAEFATIADAAKVLHTFNVRRALAVDAKAWQSRPRMHASKHTAEAFKHSS